MEIRTQKKEVRLGGLGRWGRGSPLFGGMTSCGNEDLPKGAQDICRSPDSFLQLPWAMLATPSDSSRSPKTWRSRSDVQGLRDGCLWTGGRPRLGGTHHSLITTSGPAFCQQISQEHSLFILRAISSMSFHCNAYWKDEGRSPGSWPTAVLETTLPMPPSQDSDAGIPRVGLKLVKICIPHHPHQQQLSVHICQLHWAITEIRACCHSLDSPAWCQQPEGRQGRLAVLWASGSPRVTGSGAGGLLMPS